MADRLTSADRRTTALRRRVGTWSWAVLLIAGSLVLFIVTVRRWDILKWSPLWVHIAHPALILAALLAAAASLKWRSLAVAWMYFVLLGLLVWATLYAMWAAVDRLN